MEDALLIDAPESDREEIARYIESHGGAIVLRCNGKLGSEAHDEYVAYKKANDYEDPPHDFMWIGESTLGRESSAAVVDGAGSVTRSGHHETVGERQGRQPARIRFWRWLTRSKPPVAPERQWFDDDDPLARIVNAAWKSGEPIFWQEGDPLPDRVEEPLRVERNDLPHAPDCMYPSGLGACTCGRGADMESTRVTGVRDSGKRPGTTLRGAQAEASTAP